MSKRNLALGGVLLATLVAVVIFFLQRGEGPAEGEGDGGPDSAEQRRALVQRKRAAREQKQVELAKPRVVKGIVTREADGRGVPGAVVLLTRKALTQGASAPGEPPAPLRVVTDDGGEFSLRNVSPGRYVASATAKGFLPAQRNDVRVYASEEQERIELSLSEGGHPLRGTITDIGGGPIEDVLVSVNDTESGNLFGIRYAPPAAITDEEGRYEVNLPNGSYVLTTYHPDYVATFRVTQIMDGPRVEDLQLMPGATIEGVVLARGTSKPVADAIVTFQDGRNGGMGGGSRVNMSADGRMVRSDENGRFHLDGVHPGVAKVDARAKGFTTHEAVAVPVGIGESVTGVELIVDAAYTISGFVVPKGDHERAVEGVMVGAYSLSPPSLTVAVAPTDEDGYFEILGMLPGSYTVGAIGEEMLPNIMGTSVTIKDEDITDVLVEMDVGRRIRGRVDPPAPAKLSLELDKGDMSLSNMMDGIAVASARTTAAPTGEFDLGPIKDGRYTLVAVAPDGSHGELEVEVAGTDLDGVTVTMQPRGSVAGIVVDAAGTPQPGMTVRFKKIEADPNMGAMMRGPFGDGGVPTSDDGTFTARGLDEGDYSVVVRDKKARPIPWADDGDSAEPSARVIAVAEGEHQAGVELRVQSRAGVLSGTVVDAEGAPVPDAFVTASIQVTGEEFAKMMAGPKAPKPGARERLEGVEPLDDDAGGFQLPGFFSEPPVLTDEAGNFTITQLRTSRRYTLVAEGDKGGARGRAEDLSPSRSGVVVRLEAVAGIAGVVTAGGKKVEQYSIDLEGPSRRGKSVFSKDGKFKVERIEPGEYTLTVTSDDGVARKEGIEVEADQMTELSVELEGYGTITGELVSAGSGEPISGMAVMVRPEGGDANPAQAMAMLMGGGTKTDADGKFEVEKVSPGKGKVVFLDTTAAFSGGGGFVAAQDYDIDPGQTLDLGSINGVPHDKVEEGERGKLGLGVSVATFAKRPRPPGTDLEDEEESEQDEEPTPRLWVSYVEVGGPAASEGVQPGDEVLSVEGRPVTELGPHAASIQLEGPQVKTGQEISLQLMRDGSTKSVTIRAEAKAPPKEAK